MNVKDIYSGSMGRMFDSLLRTIEPMRKLAEHVREAFTEWPELDDEQVDDSLALTWEHYSGLLRDHPKNWAVVEAHERWLEAQARRAQRAAKVSENELMKERISDYAMIYELKLLALRRLMNRYMTTNTLPTWEQEQESIKDEDARIKHKQNQPWLEQEWPNAKAMHPSSDNKAYELLMAGYEIKFKKPISKAQVRVLLGHK